MSSRVLDIAGLDVAVGNPAHANHVVRGIDLCIEGGQILGLVGESGSGKTMTALACLGMVPPPARVRGSIKVDEFEVIGKTDAALADLRGGRIAMIFQNPMRALNPFLTVGQQMTEIIRHHRRCNGPQSQVAAVEALKAARISDAETLLSRYPHQLSGGQIQRAMIALALACRPRLLIADEPTTALDVTVQAQIVALLHELARANGLAILFISHDLGLVSQLCDHVAVMYAGEIVEAGPVGSVIDSPRHPYSAQLINAVPTLGRGRQDLPYFS